MLLVGWQEGHPTCKKVVGCWRDIPGVRCRLGCDPYDAATTATDCLLLQQNPDRFYVSGTGLQGSPGERAVKLVLL